MKLFGLIGIAAVLSIPSVPAFASEARVELRAYVPTHCEMSFSADVAPLGSDSFSLGTIQQFCNTNFQLTLFHGPALGKRFHFGTEVVSAGAQSTVIEPFGRPVIGTKQLIASGLDENEAAFVSSSLVLQVTPLAL